MKKLLLNKFVKDKQTLVTVCDMDLIGKTLREGRLKLEVSSKFYGGQPVTTKEAVDALLIADTCNLVGETSISLAIENRLVDPAAIIHIAGIPHVQIIKL